jgi:predicted outer membrane repeat protein
METLPMLFSPTLRTRITNFLDDHGRAGRRHTLGGRRSSRPMLEVLEGRTLLSTDLVQNTEDSGPGSLRTTISLASPGDTIVFASGVTGITLSSPLDIEKDLDIEGPGPESLTISGNKDVGVFIVGATNDATVATIAGLTIADGSALDGGGINNGATLTVTNTTFSGNSATYFGGGIYNGGTLTVTNSTFSGNSAPDLAGGGIENEGMLTVTNSTFSGNSAPEGGGIDNEPGTTATVTNSTFSGNSATYFGGGVYSLLGALTLANTIIAGNSAPQGPDVAGHVTSSGYNLIGNSSDAEGFVATDLLGVNPLLGPLQNNGGPTETMALLPGSPAIDAGFAALVPSGINTDQRGAPRGVYGGVDIGAFEVQVFAVDFTTDSGGGSLRSAMTLANQYGGSIIAFAADGVIDLVSPLPAIHRDVQILGPGANNLTVTGNYANQVFDVAFGATATIAGLTIADGSVKDGGGILNEGTLTVTNSTVSGNSASVLGGGIASFFGTFTLADTIIATNTAPTGPDVGGTVTSLGHNLIGNSSGGSGFVASDLLNLSPLLSPLQNNGGPTETMALLPGSPAIAAGSVALIPPGVTTDQRGSARIVNGAVDIGAFESRGFIVTVTSGNNQQTAINTAFAAPLVVTVSSPYGEPVAGGVVTYTAPASGASATFPGGSNTATIDASGQASIAVAANGVVGSYTVSASVAGSGSAIFNLKNVPGAHARRASLSAPSATATASRTISSRSTKARVVAGSAKVGSAVVKTGGIHAGAVTMNETIRADKRRLILGASHPATTKSYIRVAVKPRPRQSKAVAAREA